MIFFILGGAGILYFIMVAAHTKLVSKFPLIWLFSGSFFVLLGAAFQNGLLQRIPAGLVKAFLIIVVTGVFLGVFLFLQIIRQFFIKEPEHLDCVIVLGAELKEKGPSLALLRRIEKAGEYLIRYEETVAVLSGGQGKKEPVSEAEGMKACLIQKGISENRLLLEKESTNTAQNLKFSKKVLEEALAAGKIQVQGSCSIGIITSNFHLYRALKIAKKAGFQNSVGIPAKTEYYMLPNAVLREILAITKDYLCNHL